MWQPPEPAFSNLVILPLGPAIFNSSMCIKSSGREREKNTRVQTIQPLKMTMKNKKKKKPKSYENKKSNKGVRIENREKKREKMEKKKRYMYV
jgi:hypothetical protein